MCRRPLRSPARSAGFLLSETHIWSETSDQAGGSRCKSQYQAAFCSSSDPTNRAAMTSSLWAIADAHMLVVTVDRHKAEVLDQ
jgi:hypothetical protein